MIIFQWMARSGAQIMIDWRECGCASRDYIISILRSWWNSRLAKWLFANAPCSAAQMVQQWECARLLMAEIHGLVEIVCVRLADDNISDFIVRTQHFHSAAKITDPLTQYTFRTPPVVAIFLLKCRFLFFFIIFSSVFLRRVLWKLMVVCLWYAPIIVMCTAFMFLRWQSENVSHDHVTMFSTQINTCGANHLLCVRRSGGVYVKKPHIKLVAIFFVRSLPFTHSFLILSHIHMSHPNFFLHKCSR